MSGGKRRHRCEGFLGNSDLVRGSEAEAASPRAGGRPPGGAAPPTVALDARMAFHSGIGRYIRGLAGALQCHHPALDLRLMAPPGRREFADLLPGTGRIPYSAGIYSLREAAEGAWACRRRASDVGVFHFPHFNVPAWLPNPSVVTIHDLIPFELPQFFPRSRVWLGRLALSRAVRRAGRLIAVSSATRDALERAHPGAAARTDVVHHGVDPVFGPPAEGASEALRLREGLGRFFLYVGNDKPHKNLDLLVRAFRRLQAAQPDVSLVLITDAPAGRHVPARIVPFQDDASLAAWYGAAEALVLPSLNEGFGLPALEAAACGTPVLAADIPALRETLGAVAVLVHPGHEAAWTAAMEGILADPAGAAERGRRGRARAAEFTWEAAARNTLEIYRQVAGRPR